MKPMLPGITEKGDQYKTLLYRIKALLRRVKERYVFDLTEDAVDYLSAHDLTSDH